MALNASGRRPHVPEATEDGLVHPQRFVAKVDRASLIVKLYMWDPAVRKEIEEDP